MKTAIIRSASVLASVAALGSAFLATPALAAYYPYSQPTYSYQQPVQNVCSSRFDPSCILKETQSFVGSYFNGYNQNQYQYQAPTYSYEYTNPTYQNQYSYPSYNSYNNYNSNYSYNSNPYSSGYTINAYPSYVSNGYYNNYPNNSYQQSSSYYSAYQYGYNYSYQY